MYTKDKGGVINRVFFPSLFVKAKEKMEGARMGYLEKHILHHEVHQLLTEHNIASHEVAPDSKTAQVGTG